MHLNVVAGQSRNLYYKYKIKYMYRSTSHVLDNNFPDQLDLGAPYLQVSNGKERESSQELNVLELKSHTHTQILRPLVASWLLIY